MRTDTNIDRFAVIYNKYFSKVFYFIYNICNNTALAEDIAQETFVKVLKKYDSIKNKDVILVWLNRTAYNLFIDHKRKKLNQEQYVGEDFFQVQLTDLRKNIVIEVEQKLMSECVQNKLLLLPENYRAVLVLDNEGYSNKEIASILGSSLENAKVRLHRARKIFKDIIANDCSLYRDERDVLC